MNKFDDTHIGYNSDHWFQKIREKNDIIYTEWKLKSNQKRHNKSEKNNGIE
jgi:hypothetical protein